MSKYAFLKMSAVCQQLLCCETVIATPEFNWQKDKISSKASRTTEVP
jgi:hypothetical protein